MLKLTNSFYRYLKFTCENKNNKIHVKSFTHLVCIKKPPNVESLLTTPFTQIGQQLRLLANIKKRIRLKKLPVNSNEIEIPKKSKQMSEPSQPTLSHVSYGGQFEISSDDSSPECEWQKQHGETVSSKNTDNKASCIPPDFRVWEPVLKKSDTNDGKAFKFKVLSYNVLAQYLLECHPYLYTDCSSHNLKWKVRADRLYDEIIKLDPDILCLQEVQASHLSSFYAKFEQVGYFGVFKQKTGHRKDGCAIYYKQSLFDMKDHISVEFYQPDLPILNRDNIGIMVKLAPKNYPGLPIVIATTHLLYNPKRTDVRLAQIQVFLAEIDRFAFYNNERQSSHLPIILTGDLNSTPDSAVIKLLDRGYVSASSLRDSSDWQRIGVTDNCQHLSVYLNRHHGITTDFSMTKIYNSDYSNNEPDNQCGPEQPENYRELFNSGQIGHSLKLTSTYNKYKQNGYLEATTFQDYWVTVDYIYFSYCSNLRLLERLRLPTANECEVLGTLPNDLYASDHLALAAIFELKPCKSSSL